MIALLGTLAMLALLLLKEYYAKADTPDARRLALSAQISAEIVGNDADAANRRLDDQLRVLASRNQQRQDALPAASGQAVHPAG